MAVFRKIKTDNYTTIDNEIFKNKNLSIKAKGLLCTMLSLPDTWEYSENGLVALSNDGITTIRTALKELMENGYFTRERLRDEKGILREYVYTIYEVPTLEKPKLEKPTLENLKYINNLNNKILNNKNNSSSIYEFIESNFGRTLNSIELEEIKKWDDSELTRYAIKESVLNNKCNIKYIRSILYNYEKNSITTVQQAIEFEENYKKQKDRTTYKHKETFAELLERKGKEWEEEERLENEKNRSKEVY